jgi:hypothetical protein
MSPKPEEHKSTEDCALEGKSLRSTGGSNTSANKNQILNQNYTLTTVWQTFANTFRFLNTEKHF